MPARTNTITLEGEIERITFRSEETQFLIARFRLREPATLVTVLGHIPDPKTGETLRLSGVWQQHPRFGQQFKVEGVEVLLPAGVEQIRRYLASGLIKGFGQRMAERLIAHFGEQTLTVIENEPQRLTEVRGVGPQTARRLQQAWQEHHAVRALMTFLQACGIKPMHGARIYKTYGSQALDVLKSDPYRAAEDLPRIGFGIADAVVRHLDLPIEESERAEACLCHLLETALEDGHTFLPRQSLVDQCSTTFVLDYTAVQSALETLVLERRITVDTQAPDQPVYLQPLFKAEDGIARRLQAMLQLPVKSPPIDDERLAEAVVQRMAIALSANQHEVLRSALEQRVVIITGGPGTGKTTLIRAIAAVFDRVGRGFLLAAPTGRAARRMAEVTGLPAQTLHKLLGYNLSQARFDRDQDNPLETQAVIVDEASMVDVLLMEHLLKAMPLTAHLILVGDVSQLPSVGPGTVLDDLMQSGLFTTFQLREIFRQEAQSPIIRHAHDVRHGRLPEIKPQPFEAPPTEFTFIEQLNPEKIGAMIVQLCADTLPGQLGLDGVRDVQVLTPMHKGPVGTLQLNRLLQKAFNPEGAGLAGVGGTFRAGDKVMHLRNNYQKEVFNGEIGMVCQVDKAERRVEVDFDGRQVVYEESDLDELALAYAISVHKSQGSEYPVVILPLVTQHYVMLQRNLLYTALTRARRMVIMIGSPKAVRVAVETDKPRLRRSLLGWRLNR
ncbi:MAG: ATP-dependent RecD-like DNA helicase [Desulfosarcinaceae bacterium]